MIGSNIIYTEPGSSDWLEDCWDIKQEIRKEQGLLKQNEGFFKRTYLRSHTYVVSDMSEMPLGFAVVADDTYLALLAVKPSYQGYGIGEKIMKYVIEEHTELYCHTRKSNERAIGFYKNLGFKEVKAHENYYADGESAVMLEYDSYSSVYSSSS